MINKVVHGYKMCVSPSIDFAHFMDVLVLTETVYLGRFMQDASQASLGPTALFIAQGKLEEISARL